MQRRLTRLLRGTVTNRSVFLAGGLADQSLDPRQAARALSAMVSRTAYTVFCLEDDVVSIEELVQLLAALWANAIRLER